LNFSEDYENTPGGGCSSRVVTVGGGEILRRDSRPKRVDSGRSEGENSDDGGFGGR